jgi:hypothetical protein
MTLEARLKLLETVIGQANRRIGGEQPGQGHVKRKDRVIAAAKAATDRGAMGNHVLHPEIAAGLAHQLADRGCRIIRRLRTQHQLQCAARGIVPRQPGFRLEENRIIRGSVKSLLDNEEIRVGVIEQFLNLLPIVGSASGGRTGGVGRIPLGGKSRRRRPGRLLRRQRLIPRRHRPTVENR